MPVKRVLSGFPAWLWQRASAVYMLLFIVLIPLYLWQQGTSDYNAWRLLLAEPVMALIWAVFFLALIVHAWIGVRDMLIDYVHGLVLRLSLLAIVAVSLVIMLFWALAVLLLNSGVGGWA
jgi:succinate dehydrogenase / fumarate reductase membrane anchor subunit